MALLSILMLSEPFAWVGGVRLIQLVGGMISSTVLMLAVIPAIYALVKQWRMEG